MTEKIETIIFETFGCLTDFSSRNSNQILLEILKTKGINQDLAGLNNYKRDFLNCKGKTQNSEVQNILTENDGSLVKNISKVTQALPDVPETLKELKQQGYKLAVTMSNNGKVCEEYLSNTKTFFNNDFASCFCDGKYEEKSHPGLIFNIVSQSKSYPLFKVAKICSSLDDVVEARNAGVWTIGVCEGSEVLNLSQEEYFAIKDEKEKRKILRKVEELFLSYEADYVVFSFKELPKVLDKINKSLIHGGRPGYNLYTGPQLYKLYTPGPISTSMRVKRPMLIDYGSRDTDYKKSVQRVRSRLVKYALINSEPGKYDDLYTTIIMQGSGTFGVESALGTVIPHEKALLLIITNGLYGKRQMKICNILKIKYLELEFPMTEVPDVNKIDEFLKNNPEITHVSYIHSETTTGILNPIEKIQAVCKKHNKITLVDAMSSFGAVPIDVREIDVDFLISSANKNLEGVPGFSFIIAKKSELEKCKDIAPRSLSLNCYEQVVYNDNSKGEFRFTSPVHCIRALDEAFNELEEEGGILERNKRYSAMQKRISEGMIKLNFKQLDLKGFQGPIITTFLEPKCSKYDFNKFYDELKNQKCVIYNGKLTDIKTFRLGSIGNMSIEDIERLLEVIEKVMFWDNSLN